jgi:DNA-binding transcriptional regulator of glucitol operon
MIKKHEDKIICAAITIMVICWILGVSAGWW